MTKKLSSAAPADLAALVQAHAEESTRQEGEYTISELVKRAGGKMSRYQMVAFCDAMYLAGKATRRKISKVRYYRLTTPLISRGK